METNDPIRKLEAYYEGLDRVEVPGAVIDCRGERRVRWAGEAAKLLTACAIGVAAASAIAFSVPAKEGAQRAVFPWDGERQMVQVGGYFTEPLGTPDRRGENPGGSTWRA